jgi:hypothetical protein
MFTIKWELKTQNLVTQAYQRTDLWARKLKPNGGRSEPRHTRRAGPQDADPRDVTAAAAQVPRPHSPQ